MKKIINTVEEDKMTHWFGNRMQFNQVNDATIEIITPFLDVLNDSIMVYILSLSDGTFKISDDGFTLWDLETMSTFTDNHVFDRLKNTMNLQALVNDEDELYLTIENKRDLPRTVFAFASFISTLSNTAPIMQSLKEGT